MKQRTLKLKNSRIICFFYLDSFFCSFGFFNPTTPHLDSRFNSFKWAKDINNFSPTSKFAFAKALNFIVPKRFYEFKKSSALTGT